MAMIINPPCFTSKSYEPYKLELLAWCEVTDMSRFKQGIVIALSLPEDDENQIREKKKFLPRSVYMILKKRMDLIN